MKKIPVIYLLIITFMGKKHCFKKTMLVSAVPSIGWTIKVHESYFKVNQIIQDLYKAQVENLDDYPHHEVVAEFSKGVNAYCMRKFEEAQWEEIELASAYAIT